ncbi:hypothetical protein, partial [Aeromonas veronii]|uniref:hypothetical protein n=1 Tax=Aeromonas veronii TaxID=654 RepID=UPI001C5ACC39
LVAIEGGVDTIAKVGGELRGVSDGLKHLWIPLSMNEIGFLVVICESIKVLLESLDSLGVFVLVIKHTHKLFLGGMLCFAICN